MAKVNSIVCCTSAVFTDPYWHLVGVLEQLWLREPYEARFDVFVKLGDVESRRDSQARLSIKSFGSDGETILWTHPLATRGGSDGCAISVFKIQVVFPVEGVYDLEVVLNEQLLDIQKVNVVFID